MSFARITDSMMNYGFLSGMNKSLNAQYKLMEQTSDGKLIHRPSDDPVRVIRSMQYRSAIVQNEQFTSNVKDAQSWMEMTDQAVGDLSELMSQAKSLVVRAIAPSSDISYTAAAEQLDGIINEAIQIGNTKIGDRYIFAGQMDSTQPFERVQLADPKGQSNLTVDTVVYYGDDRKVSMMTQAGTVNPSSNSVNLSGIDVFGRSAATGTQYGQATTDVFNSLIRIKEELQKTAAVNKTNSLGGTLDVDGGYTGPNTYQDFAVKIDALKTKIETYVQSNTGGGSLALSWTGEAGSMPAYAAGSLRMRIDALKVSPTVTAPTGHVTGALTMNSTTNPSPAAPLYFRVDAVQVETGAVSRSNALSGALTIDYNGYRGTPPKNLMVRTAATTPAYGVTKSDAASGDLAVTGITGSAGAASKIRIDTVVAGQITGASYFDTASNSWQAATAAAGNPSTLVLGTTGMTATIDTAAGNSTGDEYAVETSKRASSIQYSVDGGTTWVTAPAPVPASYLSQSNSLGGAASVNDPDQATRLDQTYKVRVDGVGAGLVTAASVSADGGATWNTAAVAAGVVTLPSGISMTIAASGATAVNDTYQYKVPPNFTLVDPGDPTNLNGANIGMKVSVASAQENDVGATADTYTIPLTNTGKVMQASYSNDNATWTSVPAVDTNKETNPLTFTLGAPFVGLSVQLGTEATNLVGDVHHVTAMATAGEVAQASYSLDSGTTWQAATADPAAGVGSFILGSSGFNSAITANTTNAGGNTYELSNLAIDADREAASVSYSLDKGNTWTKATAPVITKSTATSGDLTLGGKYTGLPAYQDVVMTAQAWKVNAAITQSNSSSGAMKMAYAGAAIPAAVTAAPPQMRIDAVDATTGKTTALSYSDDGITWKSATAQTSQGPTVFSLGAMDAPSTTDYTGFSVTIATASANAVGNTYTTAPMPAASLAVGDPALVSYTTAPAPAAGGTITPSTPVWSMKGADPTNPDFSLPDGVTADIETNTSTVLGTSTYSFRMPPRYTLTSGVEVSVDPSANNRAKDAYTFHMARSVEHTEASDTLGPDLDWLSDKGLGDMDTIHDQILSAVVEVGTQSSMYEMTGNMLSNTSTNLTAVMSSNEDIDMAKAIVDMKLAENTYKAALSFGSRIMPTSLLDFLR